MIYLLALTLIFVPAYAVRFSIFRIPADLLMLWVILVWIIFFGVLFWQKKIQTFFSFLKTTEKKIILLVTLFFLAGIISLFDFGITRQKLGEFIVLFVQPISLFFIGGFIVKNYPQRRNILLVACYVLLALAGIYAIVQYFTLLGLPMAWWGNSVEPKRAVSFFGHPDFYGLFAAPLLAFLIPDALRRTQNFFASLSGKIICWKDLFLILAFVAGIAGLIFSLSRAGWVGLFAAFVIYIFVAADKKTRLIGTVLLAAAILFISFTNFRYRIIGPFITKEKSAYSRIVLWQSGLKGISENPILGLGLTGYSNQYRELITDPTLDTHNFPHNIFLDLWVETGLLGLISLTGLIAIYIYQGFRGAHSPPEKEESPPKAGEMVNKNLIPLSISLFLLCLLVQGQIDNPYFKNDLAMVFWIILSLTL